MYVDSWHVVDHIFLLSSFVISRGLFGHHGIWYIILIYGYMDMHVELDSIYENTLFMFESFF